MKVLMDPRAHGDSLAHEIEEAALSLQVRGLFAMMSPELHISKDSHWNLAGCVTLKLILHVPDSERVTEDVLAGLTRLPWSPVPTVQVVFPWAIPEHFRENPDHHLYAIFRAALEHELMESFMRGGTFPFGNPH